MIILIIWSLIIIACSSFTDDQFAGFSFHEEPEYGNKKILDKYDFVVVGSGPGGSVVASRLSENPNWSVLLLEAGKEESFLSRASPIPHYFQFTDYNWNFVTERQKGACLGLVNGRCPWPAGKGTGGSSLINNNIYTRGNRRDYDGWAAAGNTGWSYKEVLPYFKKSVEMNIPDLRISSFHGTDGPLPVNYSPFRSKLMDAFLASAKEINLQLVDYNNPYTHEGFSPIQGTVNRRGQKVSAYRSFIVPNRNRKNLHFVIKSRVTKILIDPSTNAAYGVEFVKRKQRRMVRARKEVIVSAGTFNSAQLLMLSGIGPKEHLTKIGIPVVQDLRVGDNLQEHPAFAGISFTVNVTGISVIAERILKNPVKLLMDFYQGQDFISTNMVEGLGYVHTKYNGGGKNVAPDIEYMFGAAHLGDESGIGGDVLRRSMGIPDDSFNYVYGDILNKDGWSIGPMLMYPESRGTVRLKNANPWQPPKIQSNFFNHSLDLYRIVEGIKMIVKLSKTEAFQRLGSKLHKKPIPACRSFEFGTDEYWACATRQWTMQMHHQCGTCKMGPSTDRNAVVDPRLKVYGVEKLRVVDCSIIPTIPGAHTLAAAYMIGEKGADMIKEDWNWKH